MIISAYISGSIDPVRGRLFVARGCNPLGHVKRNSGIHECVKRNSGFHECAIHNSGTPNV
jgi:hypothetical protein